MLSLRQAVYMHRKKINETVGNNDRDSCLTEVLKYETEFDKTWLQHVRRYGDFK